MTKTCNTCGKDKPEEQFSFQDKKNGIRRKRCKDCDSAYQRQRRQDNPELVRTQWKKASQKYYTTDGRRNKTLRAYGLTEETYNCMFEEQKGLCKICSKAITLVVDHCHSTDVVRGLLCNSCNVGLGCFEDDIDRMLKAIEYLGAV